jgi:hypothetical protein
LPFATWWALTSDELRDAGDRYPTSSTVLAGALVEAALVAIAQSAKSAGQWNQKFLTAKEPPGWKFGELIDQAEAAGTFSKSDALMARGLAEFRNRIHAGKFATPGRPPAPPSLNPQQPRIARDHLDHLLDKILQWTHANCPDLKQ